ncbi:hypothetical protein QTP70_029694, partial [Hemibagrus guttatus]
MAKPQNQMLYLRQEDGTITTEAAEMRREATKFYIDLYSAEDCDPSCTEELLRELPKLSPEQSSVLVQVLNFKKWPPQTFRLQAAQRLLYEEETAWAGTAYTLLRRVEDLNYVKHLFVLNLREMDLSATTLFYQSVLRAWSSVLRISRINAQPFPCTEEEPLFHNPLIQSRIISSPYIQQRFRKAGITRIKDLRSGNSWKTARELCAETGVLSARLMQRLLRE